MNFGKKLVSFGFSLVTVLSFCVLKGGLKVNAAVKKFTPSVMATMVGDDCEETMAVLRKVIGKDPSISNCICGPDPELLKKDNHLLYLWSTRGRECYRNESYDLLKNSKVAILTFNISYQAEPFLGQRIQNANYWCQKVDDLNKNGKIKIFYWFNKNDDTDKNFVFKDIKCSLKHEANIEFGENAFFISVETGEGVEEAMNAIWEYAINELGNNSQESAVEVTINNENPKKTCLLI